METKTGVIKFINESAGTNKNGPWTRYEFEFENGFKIATFDKKIGENFGPGDSVIFTVGKDGQFYKLITMDKAGSQQTEQAQTAQPQPAQSSNREKSIISQALTKAWAASGIDQTVTKEQVLETYNFFLENL